MISKINGKLFADMIIQGAQNLSNNADLVDSLNVYPVPDGDTGTNMNLTMTSGREEVENNLSKNIGELGKTFSKGYIVLITCTSHTGTQVITICLHHFISRSVSRLYVEFR